MSLFRPVVTDLQNQSGTQIPRVWCLFLLSAIADLNIELNLKAYVSWIALYIYTCIHIVSYIDISCICIHLFIYIIHMFPLFQSLPFVGSTGVYPIWLCPYLNKHHEVRSIHHPHSDKDEMYIDAARQRFQNACPFRWRGLKHRGPCVTSADMFNDIYLYVDLDYAVISWYDTILYDVYGIFMS